MPENFGGTLQVIDRTISANSDERPIALSLSDVTVSDKDSAIVFARYFEQGFDLFVNIYMDIQ